MDTRNNRREVDIGLAVAGALLGEGQTRTFAEISAYCGLSIQGVSEIEKTALKKIRKQLRTMEVLRDFLD